MATSAGLEDVTILIIRTGLMITTSHRTFSGQKKQLSDQTKFGQTYYYKILSIGNFIEFAEVNQSLS